MQHPKAQSPARSAKCGRGTYHRGAAKQFNHVPTDNTAPPSLSRSILGSRADRAPDFTGFRQLGAVRVDEQLTTTFYGKTRPISELWVPEALAVSGHTREQHLEFDEPGEVMTRFRDWVNSVSGNGRPIFASDNNAFDFAWINWYFHYYLGSNPFGFSSRRIGDMICGLERDLRFNWKRFRKTTHDHNPVNDARGNAEALLHFLKKHDVGAKEFVFKGV